MNESQKVVIITGADRGIGAGLATAFRRGGYAVVATSLAIPTSDESDFLTVQGDITDVDTARRVVEQGTRPVRTDRHPDQQRGNLHRQALHRVHTRRLCRHYHRELDRVLPHRSALDPA